MTNSRRLPTQASHPQVIRQVIRMKKEDSAFVYWVLEGHEGITSYSTLAHKPGDAFRDIELRTPTDFLEEVREVIRGLGEMVYELKPE